MVMRCTSGRLLGTLCVLSTSLREYIVRVPSLFPPLRPPACHQAPSHIYLKDTSTMNYGLRQSVHTMKCSCLAALRTSSPLASNHPHHNFHLRIQYHSTAFSWSPDSTFGTKVLIDACAADTDANDVSNPPPTCWDREIMHAARNEAPKPSYQHHCIIILVVFVQWNPYPGHGHGARPSSYYYFDHDILSWY